MRPHSKNRWTRRDFIKAFGVSAATIPFLPEFLFRPLQAQSVNPLRFFAVLYAPHGGHFMRVTTPTTSNIIPTACNDLRLPTTSTPFVSGYSIRKDPLTNFLRADGSLNAAFNSAWNSNGLYPYLNIINNSEIPREWGHGYPPIGYLPNDSGTHWRTLDNCIYQASQYYDAPAKKLLYLGRPQMSVSLSNRSDIHSPLVMGSQAYYLRRAYAQLFTQPPADRAAASNAALDKVLSQLEAIKRNRNVPVDKEGLDIHIERMQRLHTIMSAPGGTPYPGNPSLPSNSGEETDFIALMLGHFIATGQRPLIYSSEVGELGDAPDTQYGGDVHQDYIHYCSNADVNFLQPRIDRLNAGVIPWHSSMIKNNLFKLANELKTRSNGAGGNLLDDSLIFYTYEAGARTHENIALSCFTVGKAAGRLRGGNLIDGSDDRASFYTQHFPNYNNGPDPLMPTRKRGLPYLNILNTICAASGLIPAQYEINPGKGFGWFDLPDPNSWPTRPRVDPSAKLNFLLNI